MEDNEIREALNRHWAASDANDFNVEHDIYREDALLEYPQSGERIKGPYNIQASRGAPRKSHRSRVRTSNRNAVTSGSDVSIKISLTGMKAGST